MLALSAFSGAFDPEPTLREAAGARHFAIGSVIQGRYWKTDAPYRDLLAHEFNLAVAITFMDLTQPEAGKFNFKAMDESIAFANEHQMKLFGAALIYRQDQNPEWLKEPKSWNASKLDAVLKTHIETVVKHGGDAFSIWEVVNEPLSAPNNPWGQAFGRDKYIERAFRYAKAANPNAQMLLNQTFGRSGVDRATTDEFFDLVTHLKKAGTPIDAVGVEMHLRLEGLRATYLDELRYFLERSQKAGVIAYVTELDVTDPDPSRPADVERQAQVFHDVTRICIGTEPCHGLIVWGLSDKRSWIRDNHNEGHPNARPLLFDDNYVKKSSYSGVLTALQGR